MPSELVSSGSATWDVRERQPVADDCHPPNPLCRSPPPDASVEKVAVGTNIQAPIWRPSHVRAHPSRTVYRECAPGGCSHAKTRPQVPPAHRIPKTPARFAKEGQCRGRGLYEDSYGKKRDGVWLANAGCRIHGRWKDTDAADDVVFGIYVRSVGELPITCASWRRGAEAGSRNPRWSGSGAVAELSITSKHSSNCVMEREHVGRLQPVDCAKLF